MKRSPRRWNRWVRPGVVACAGGSVEADNAEAGLAILRSKQRIDLLVTDVGLPGINGRQLAEMAQALRPGLKVLFVTGYAQAAAVRGECLDAGMEMVAKPFAIGDMSEKIRSMPPGG